MQPVRSSTGRLENEPDALSAHSSPALYLQPPMQWTSVLTWLAGAWILGTALGLAWQWPVAWLVVAGVLAVALMLDVSIRRRQKHSRWRWTLAMLLATTTAGAWTTVHSSVLPANHLGRYVNDSRQLVRVAGWIDQWPRMTAAPVGAMARFGHHQPATLYELRVTQVEGVDGPVDVTGRLLVRQPGRDARLRPGQRVSVVGWLTGPSQPRNPGEMDFSQWMIDRGLAGFLAVDDQGAWRLVDDQRQGQRVAGLAWWRGWAGSEAMASLGQGLDRWPAERSFLRLLLLGRKGHGLEVTETTFRRVGLAHLLSISGAHLGMLVSLVAVVLLVMGVRPWSGAVIVMAVLGLYLLAVPWQVPVLRAAIMALAVVVGYALGRKVAVLDPLAAACIFMLIWRPGEVMSPGFQLSFGVVAALIRFTGPVARWMTPWSDLPGHSLTLWQRGMGWMLGYIGANVVAFAVSVPLVMFHFQNISPLTVLMSIVTLPLISLVMAMGYLKIAVGLLLPGLGADLAWPLWWLSNKLLWIVGWTSQWRVSFMELSYAPTAAWTAAAVGVIAALFAGWFHRRPMALTGCGLLIVGWLAVGQMGYRTHLPSWPAQPANEASQSSVALRMNVFAVGDGNCYLLRFYDGQTLIHTMMYDCGGQRVDAGVRTILPALHELGVRRIDTLVISHADMDHFNGVVDLARRVSVGSVHVSPQMLDSEDDPATRPAPIFMLRQLRMMGLEVQTIQRGWRRQLRDITITALWPTPDFTAGPDNDNDLSIVLQLELPRRRLLLSGDIQEDAFAKLLTYDGGDGVAAIGKMDVTDMPHHGSYTGKPSLAWMDRLQPGVMIQSSGRRRVERDPWQGLVRPDVTRLQSGRLGMIELDFHQNGELRWRHFPDPTSHTIPASVTDANSREE